jgi:hypothetical protein
VGRTGGFVDFEVRFFGNVGKVRRWFHAAPALAIVTLQPDEFYGSTSRTQTVQQLEIIVRNLSLVRKFLVPRRVCQCSDEVWRRSVAVQILAKDFTMTRINFRSPLNRPKRGHAGGNLKQDDGQ